jgi:hypothetical protein
LAETELAWPAALAAFGPRASNVEARCGTMSISMKLVRRIDERPKGAGSENKETDDAGYGVRESH